MAHDVFISYYHDDKAFADAACAKLEQHGVRCWIAPRDVVPGDSWPRSIIHAINDARVMVLVFSSKANESPQINKEVERAVHKGVIVVPVRIEDVIPVESLEFFFGDVHWLDALTPPIENHLDHLADTVKMLLERTEPLDAARPAAPVQPTDHKRAPAAETIASPVSSSLQSLAEDPSAASSPESKKPAVWRVWLRTTLGVAAGLIVLLAVFYLGIRHGKRPSAVGQVSQTAAASEPNASEQANAPISSPSNSPSSAISTSPSQTAPPPAVGQIATSPEPNAGEHWNALGSGTKTRLASIFGTSDGKRLWAVGEKGTILESDDGQHWIARNSGTSEHLDWIFGTGDGNHLWAAGENGTILQSDDGEHWNALSSGAKSRLISIFATSDGSRLWAVGDKGTILESDGGEHWNALSSGTSEHLDWIFGTSDGKRLWAVGRNGTILESGDGQHWNPCNSGTSNQLATIFGTSDGNRLWAVGDKGTILESDNGKN